MNKKCLSLLLSVITAFGCIALPACDVSIDGDGGKIQGELTQISAPKNVRVENGVVKWSAVSNADSYIVQVGDESHQAVTSYLEYPLSSILTESASDLYVKVKAVPSSSILYSESEWSELCGPFTYTKNSIADIVDDNGNKNVIKKLECFSSANENIAEKFSSFKDENYYYYIFHSGRIYNVALENGSKVYYQGIGEQELVFSTVKSTSDEIKQSASEVLEESTHQEYSFSESFKYTHTKNSSFGLSLSGGYGGVSAGMNVGGSKSNSFEIGLSATQTWGFKDTKTVSKSYETSASKTETTQQTKTYKFNPNCPAGNYLYALIGDLDVYNLVLIDPNSTSKEFEVFTFSSVVTSNKMMLYLGDDVEYNNKAKDTLEFKMSDVEKCFDKEPTVDISQYYTQAQDYVFKVTPKNCKLDNGYDDSVSASGDDLTRHDGFYMGELIMRGTLKVGDNYTLRPNEDFGLSFHMLVNPNKLQIKNTTYSFIDNDPYKEGIQGLSGLKGQKVGYGICYVKCVYDDNTDNTGEPYYLMDFFKDKYKDNYLSINVPIDENKALRKIIVTIVYEIQCGADGSILVVPYNKWNEYTNWRCDYEINFIDSSI